MNAGRKYLNAGDLSGRVYLTSGLGGMSGAQAKASVIAGCIGVIAEVKNFKRCTIFVGCKKFRNSIKNVANP